MTLLRQSVAVLGGGLTGLVAAHRLTLLGHRARIFEATARLGGAIRTEISDGWLIEAGPNSLREDSAEVGAILHELGLGSETIETNADARRRYLASGGGMAAVPSTISAFLKSPLLSPVAKARVALECCTRRRHRIGDVSVAEVVRDHFGAEVLERAVQPLVGGIWAGDASRLSARSAFPRLAEIEQTHGSLLRGMAAAVKGRRAAGGGGAARILSFRRGLQTLPWALTSRLPEGAVVLNAAIDSLGWDGRWQVRWRHGSEQLQDGFDAVIAPLPAEALARLRIADSEVPPLAEFSAIAQPPVVSVFLGYRREQVAHPLDGFGVLVGPAERRSILGAIFSSSVFPRRAPPGCVALTVLAGGSLQPEVARLPLPELLQVIQRDLKDLVGASGEPVFVRHTFWPRAIPQYEIGHDRYRETIAACERRYPGLYIGGQAVDGISLSNCISAGCKLANRAGLRP